MTLLLPPTVETPNTNINNIIIRLYSQAAWD